MKKVHYCDNCGEQIGTYEAWPGEPQSCGKHECDKELRLQQESDADERRFQERRDEDIF